MEKIALLLAALVALSQAGFDTTVCTYNTDVSQKPFPTIPDVFVSMIEVNIVNNKTTKNIFEIFDSPNSRAAIFEMEATGPYKNISLTGQEIFDFKNNEIITVVPFPDKSVSCNVQSMNSADDTFVLGDGVTSKSGFTAKGAFRINAAHPAKYIGDETLDTGMKVDHWQNCIYLDSYDATVTADWYFTSDDDWNAALGVPSIPTRLVVKGKANKKGAPNRPVYNVYTFSWFRDSLSNFEERRFQVPRGTVCPFLKDYGGSNPIPNLGRLSYFSFTTEVLQFDGVISTNREFVDSRLKLSSYEYKPISVGQLNSPFGDNRLFEVHDFNSGVSGIIVVVTCDDKKESTCIWQVDDTSLSYSIDTVRGNCTVSAIDDAAFDVAHTSNNAVRMKTMTEFFNLDKTDGGRMNWTYTGKREIRGIKADIYASERVGFPDGVDPTLQSTWEIGFVSDDYITAVGQVYETREPMYMWVRIPSMDYEVTYNIFDFSEEQPDFGRYGYIRKCYSDDQQQLVTFKLEGKHKELITNNQREFHVFIILSLIEYTSIMPTRISRVRFNTDQIDGTVQVEFILLDPPTAVSSNAKTVNPKTLLSSSEFLSLMRVAIDAGQFIVNTADTNLNKLYPVKAITGTLSSTAYVEVTTVKVTLDAGAAAGYAIGFFLIGAILTVVIIIVVNKVRGKSLPNLQLSFAPKTFNNES